MQYYSTLRAKLIYIFSINDAQHRGCIKIGDATLDQGTSIFLPANCSELKAAARHRIDQYTKTAGIAYTLLHAELTLYIHDGAAVSFNDKEVHNVLLRSGIKRHDFSMQNQGREWFECSLETALKAIQAVKEGRSAISKSEIVPISEQIEFRPEQQEAINKTVKKYKSGGKAMLWNAKMRFGKTLSALQVVKELGYKRTIIITHRPVVDEGWFEDFSKIFDVLDGYVYGSRDRGETFEHLEKAAKKNPDFKYVYFASIQDLRGAELVGGKFNKNQAIFAANYDLLIVDEAHEGTQTELGQKVIEALNKENTHVLNLSGTPFNLLEDYREDEIYTWDYVMEQKAKADWDLNHFGDPNPYAGLPRLNIFTFDLGKVLDGFEDIEDKAFNFTEFFRTWTGNPEKDFKPMPEGMEGRFVHEEHVKSFLDLIVKYDENSNYPFSTVEFRKSFRHTLWMVPGVRQARALSLLLQQHPIFSQFQIVNVAGDGDEEVPNDDALKMVKKAMGDDPEETMTITLSCGKLTTGVTVKPWTAVMYLSGSSSTDAKAYMQTIFRVQSPYTTKNGKRKENCYVFDFAPDRTLKVLAETARVSNRAKSTATKEERIKLGEFLNFCPVIGYNGTQMATFNVERMLEELKRAYISRVTKNGCDDPRLYNMEMLRKLDAEALAKFEKLHQIIGMTKANHSTDKVDMAKNGLTDEEYQKLGKLQKKKKKELTEEEKRLLEEAKEKKKNADAAISILRGISIRLPLIMYGAELKNEGEDITLENFTDPELIDEKSWEEFMPRGVTKELFREFIPFYDPDMFRAVGRNYRDLVREADKLAPMERTRDVARIFSYFRNPDKETVLTPWRVVNMHIGDCIGGQVFFEEDMQTEGVKPRFVDHGEVTTTVFKDPNTRILEINSKTGLYPLYMTYSVFAEKLQAYRDKHMLATDVPLEVQNEIWDEVLRDNIFVICKTEMAKSITKRTLRGFRQAKVNARYFEDLINKITNQPDLFMTKVGHGVLYWKNKDLENDMKFNAIVGNPPYQILDGGNSASATPIYNKFIDVSRRLRPLYISMIMPSRWYAGGKGLDDFRSSMLNDRHISRLIDYTDSKVCFPTVDIAGGVCYFRWDAQHNGDCEYTNTLNGHTETIIKPLNEYDVFIRYPKADSILQKVLAVESRKMSEMVSARKPFGLSTDVKFLSEGDISLRNTSGIGKYKSSLISTGAQLIDKWKVMISYLSSEHAGQPDRNGQFRVLSTMEVLPPKCVCTETYLIAGAFETEDEAYNLMSYLKTKLVRLLIGQIAIGQHITRSCFAFVPIQDWSRPWTDEDLYKMYRLSGNEIDFIESIIKPVKSDELFNSEDLIDPEFGSFSLLECGVKIGDTIVYNNDLEVIVRGDNEVEFEGELYTLAQFTAKYMPRNKRSVSGVCQGPKYFTKGGTSLYQMKETFLGRKK